MRIKTDYRIEICNIRIGCERKSNLREEHREGPPWAGSGSVMNADEVHPGAGSVRFRRLPELAGHVSPALTACDCPDHVGKGSAAERRDLISIPLIRVEPRINFVSLKRDGVFLCYREIS